MGITFKRYGIINLHAQEQEPEAVKIALASLRADLRKTLDASVVTEGRMEGGIDLYIGTAGISGFACLEQSDGTDGRRLCVPGEEIRLLREKKEAYLIQEQEGALFIIGSDRRGTVYGIYDFCELLGVSPWYFFADVPVRRPETVEIEDGYRKFDFPTVEYRGIFINDEEELERFAQRYMREDTIAVRTYERIFELLLRLKLNLLWPAMHVNSFNRQKDCRELADRMGLVIGTSHCDMLMRSNLHEWEPWLKEKGYEAEYDYSIPGRNREILKEYWRESAEENREYEVCYTIGMRGIHDSGLESKEMAGLSGTELRDAKSRLLEEIIREQTGMIRSIAGPDALTSFVPYKEVLELYDSGLHVPDDTILIWADDNYGFNRRYPQGKEKERKGGSGIYYHNSYWAGPDNSASYLFINTIPLAQTRNELMKDYRMGIRRLWVTNFGALKPLEQEMAYYAALAWEAGRIAESGSPDPLNSLHTYDERLFLETWIDRMFSGSHGKQMAGLLTAFDQIMNVRKPEHMDIGIFSQTAYGDEAAGRIHELERIADEADRIYDGLPKEEKTAFFELFLMKIHASWLTACMYYFADRSRLCCGQGKLAAADLYTRRSMAFDRCRQKLLSYYNRVLAGGKWNGIVTPEDFPPPRTPLYPACMPPLREGKKALAVTCWNEEAALCFSGPGEKWFEAANAGPGNLRIVLFGPDWLEVLEDRAEDPGSGTRREKSGRSWQRLGETGGLEYLAGAETRFLVRPVCSTPKEGVIQILNAEEEASGCREYRIPVKVKTFSQPAPDSPDGMPCRTEEDGRICLEADDGRILSGWKRIPCLGRGRGSLLQAEEGSGEVRFCFAAECAGEILLELHRYPSLDSAGRIRVKVSLDGAEAGILESFSKDSGADGAGDWLPNVKNWVDRLTLRLTLPQAGRHMLTFTAIDPFFAFSRVVLYTRERKENNLGYCAPGRGLPSVPDLDALAEKYYPGGCTRERRLYYRAIPRDGRHFRPGQDGMLPEEFIFPETEAESPATPDQILNRASQPAQADETGAIRIEMAAALSGTENARTEGEGWSWCNTPFHSDTGLALFLPGSGPVAADPAEAPALHYRIAAKEAEYRLWIRVLMWGTPTSHMAVGIDGMIYDEEELFGGRQIWNYSAEQIWEWIPVWCGKLTQGLHTVSVFAKSHGLRFSDLALTAPDRLP